MYHEEIEQIKQAMEEYLFVFCHHKNRAELQNLKSFGSGRLINKHLRVRFLNRCQKVLVQKFLYKLLIQVFVDVQILFFLRLKTNTLKNISQRKSISKSIPTQRS